MTWHVVWLLLLFVLLIASLPEKQRWVFVNLPGEYFGE